MKKYVSATLYTNIDNLDELRLVKDGIGGISVFSGDIIIGQADDYASGCEDLNHVLKSFKIAIKAKLHVRLGNLAVLKINLPIIKSIKDFFATLFNSPKKQEKVNCIAEKSYYAFNDEDKDFNYDFVFLQPRKVADMVDDVIIPERIKCRIKSIDIVSCKNRWQ